MGSTAVVVDQLVGVIMLVGINVDNSRNWRRERMKQCMLDLVCDLVAGNNGHFGIDRN